MEVKLFKINGTGPGQTYEAAAGELLKIEWDCPGCDFCIIYPYNWKVDCNGEMEIYIYETMTVILRAVKDRESVQKENTAKLSGGEDVKGISVSPAGPAGSGEETKFDFQLIKTAFGYLDHGIGRVEGRSGSYVLKNQYTVYRYDILTAGGETGYKEKTVKAGRSDAPEIQRLKYVMMKNGNEQKYELSWRVANNDGKDVIIEASDHKTTFAKNASGRASFARTGGETVTLSVRCDAGEKGKIEFADIYPFELK